MVKKRLIPLGLGILIAFLGLAALAPAAQAAPAAPLDIPLTQPDGTPFTARQWGDEWLHGYETVDGFTILQAEDGAWVYAARGVDGALVPVTQDGQRLLVGKATPPSQSSGARPDLPAGAPVRETLPSSPLLGQNSGTQRVLMVMVNFLDRTRIYNPVTTFLPKFFGASSSIRDFYLDASFNALTLEPAIESYATVGVANDGLIEVTLAMNHPSDTNQSRTIAAAAYNAVNPYINFASYDSDGDGYVSGKELHFVMIIAGYEESYGGYVYPCIWGHQWSLVSPLLLDGVYVGTSSADGDYGGYAMFGEIHSDHPATIGIMVHEMGHNLTWPDLYDTNGGSEGVGRWSIMGSASWNYVTYPGDTPGLPDAFLKWYQGWITPTTALNGQTYTLDRTDITPEALIVGANPGGVNWEFTRYSGTGEYWLVENRQLNGYDAALPGCGLLIWHIDETVTYTNSANATEERPLVALEQADGLLDLQNQADRGDAGDPYPGSTGNRWFNDTTNPNSRYYSGASSGHAVTVNSTACASAMSVSYAGPASLPGAFSKSSPGPGSAGVPTSLTLNWGASTGATSYEYCIDTSNDNACSTWSSVGASTSVGIGGLSYGTTYYWHVRALNSYGVTYSNGSPTAFWPFTTGSPPGAFSKGSPPSGTTGTLTSLTLSWDVSTGATSYQFCYDTTNDGACSTWSSVGTSTSVGISGLSYGTTYYWQVRALNSFGTTYANGTSTAFWNFTTGSLPGAFSKSSPASGASNLPTSLTLSWGTSTGATGYEYCIDTTNDGVCSPWVSVGTSTNVGIGGLSTGTTYYWHVRALNSFGTTYSNGSSTAFWNFTTGSPPAAFSKSSPVNGTTGAPTSLTLAWGVSSGATSYEYCYDTTNDGMCSSWTSTSTSTSVGIGGLAYGTTYYWQVRALNSFGMTYANGPTTHWNFTTGSPPGAFSKNSPASGTTGAPTSLTLSWGASSGATSYQFCYDTTNDGACSTWNSVGATSVGIGGLAYGTTYYWHVRALNSFGTTYSNGSSTAFWSFTTGSPPGAFSKSSPGSGSSNLPTSLTLSWGTSTGATSYEFCYDTTNDGACSTWNSVGTSTGVGLGGLPYGTTYYWHVRALNSFGTTYSNGASTAFWSFTTYSPPAAFSKSSPANGAASQPVSLSLSWGTSTGAASYEYCIDTSDDDACSTWTSTGTATSVGIGGLAYGTTYFWHVRAVNSIGTTYSNGSSTAFWSFTTGSPPGAFSKSSPPSGTTGAPTSLTLSWGSSTGATSYEFCYDTTNDGACSTWNSVGTSTGVGLGGLPYGTTYYWHVRALNSFGTTYSNGASTAFWSFTTGSPPAAFSKSNPANGATNQFTSLTLSWGTSAGAASYEYCIDMTNDSACSMWVSVGSSTSVGISGLAYGTTYYWQARALNSFGTTYSNGASTAFWSFTTGSPPAAFSKSSPANGATNQFTSLTLSWGTSAGATGYEYCYDTSNDGACSTWNSVGTSTGVGLGGLSVGTTYYWQVRALNSFGTTYANGTSTAFWSFTTYSPPAAFSKSSPADEETDQLTSLTLSWEPSTGADVYEYCYDTSNDGACSTWRGGTFTNVSISGLAYSTTYYWHVRAVNSFTTTYSNGASTAFWSFTTGAPPAAFSKSSPADDAANQLLSLTLSWGAASGATSYEYCYDTSNDGACSGWASTGTATNASISGLSASTIYYWHVRALNAYGTTYSNGSSTAFWSITTGSPPAAFSKGGPADEAANQPLSLTLDWDVSAGASSYEYCYDTSDDAACGAWVSTGGSNSAALNGLSANTTYYWHVRALNSIGTTYANGSSTAFWSFTTGTPPGSFSKSSPADGAADQPTSLTLSWGASADAAEYHYCYDTTNDNACASWVSTDATSAALSGLSAGTTYYWHVRAVNSIGTTYADGASTAFWAFTTGTLPAAFGKTSPADGAADQPTSLSLSWEASSGATSYEYCYDTTDDGTCSAWVSAGPDTSASLSGLSTATTYYWQVRALNAYGVTYADGSGGAFWWFNTADVRMIYLPIILR